MLQKAAEWRFPVLVASVHIHSASDRIQPAVAATAVRDRGAHPTHVAAELREMLPATAVPHLAGVVGDPFKMGRQGAPRAPARWNQYISGCLESCHAAWAARGRAVGVVVHRHRPLGGDGVGRQHILGRL